MRFDGWNDELYHHGIKGQRWGIRRYQNPDGTLTEEGKARYQNYKGYDNFDDAVKIVGKDRFDKWNRIVEKTESEDFYKTYTGKYKSAFRKVTNDLNALNKKFNEVYDSEYKKNGFAAANDLYFNGGWDKKFDEVYDAHYDVANKARNDYKNRELRKIMKDVPDNLKDKVYDILRYDLWEWD